MEEREGRNCGDLIVTKTLWPRFQASGIKSRAWDDRPSLQHNPLQVAGGRVHCNLRLHPHQELDRLGMNTETQRRDLIEAGVR